MMAGVNIHSVAEQVSMPLASRSKREIIVQATIRLLATHGFHGTPVALIAQEAGVGAGTIYRYFKDKDTLVIEVFRQVDEEFKKTLLADYDETLPIRARFMHLCRGVFLYSMANPDEFRFMEQFYNSPYGTNLRRQRLDNDTPCASRDFPLQQVLDRGQAQGVIKELPFVALLALAMGPIVLLVKDNIAGLVRLDDALIDETIAALWDAVRN